MRVVIAEREAGYGRARAMTTGPCGGDSGHGGTSSLEIAPMGPVELDVRMDGDNAQVIAKGDFEGELLYEACRAFVSAWERAQA